MLERIAKHYTYVLVLLITLILAKCTLVPEATALEQDTPQWAYLPRVSAGQPYLSSSRFGVNAHLPDDRTLDLIQDAGITWVRISAPWRLLQPEPDSYEWVALDDRLAETHRRGLHTFLTISETPTWASTSGLPNVAPANPDDWEAFMTTVVERYGDSVAAWGIWNEPNGGDGEYFSGTPAQFRDTILIPGCRGIRDADPNAVIVAPGITVHTGWSEWMTDIFDARVRDYVDVVSVHLYVRGDVDDLFWLYDARPVLEDDIMPVRVLLQELDLESYPLWIEETGWPTGGQFSVTVDVQARYMRALIRELALRPEITRVFWYDMIDDPQATGTAYDYGLLMSDYTPKPAYYELKAALIP